MSKIKTKKENGIEGIYRGASRSFGFVCIDKGTEYEKEVYVSHRDSMCAMDGDKVLVMITKKENVDKKAEGKIIKILERDTCIIVGVFEKKKDFGFVRPMSKKITFDLHIDKKYFKDAVNDSIVECKLLEGKKVEKGDNPEGVILSVIGHKNDIDATILAITKDYKIPSGFDDEVLKEAENVAKPISRDDLKGRKDIRDIVTVTIDGEDARDLDDAVSLVDMENGHKKLYVSIADVSHYVKENTPLDFEARKRGNSVYLVDRVIPMLPHILSNGVCSLNENEDRLCKTCEMEFDEDGKIVSHDIYESVINSDKRMSYTGVHYVLTGEDKRKEKVEDFTTYEPYRDMLKSMYDLSLKIRKRRLNGGAIEFDFKESKIVVDDKLNPIDIKEYERYESHKLIEDFMLSANETVAKDFFDKKVPFLYRIHEECDDEKIQNLINILPNFNLSLDYHDKIKPMDIQKLLSKVKGQDSEYVVSRLTLRSMQQARYSVECNGHFALSLKYYTHFTSPIRRYSDLTIHRIIGEYLHKDMDEKRTKHYHTILPNIALSTSICERKAIDCERDVDDLMKCRYMKEKIQLLARGIFDFEDPVIRVSSESLSAGVVYGGHYSGTMDVESINETPFKAMIFSSHARMRLTEGSLVGDSGRIHYDFDAEGMEIGEQLEGVISIVSNGGE
ncbi:MAG: ribonuclease R, partial [Lachnospiraceae bacterium]|nr:ribonuclease R [Lachnospiraceae bacterium]